MSFATSTNPNSPPARLRLALRQPEPPHEPYIRCWYHLSSYSNFFVFFQPLTSDLEHSSNPLFWVLPVLLLGRRRNLVSIDLANSHAGEITAHNVIPHPNPTTSLSLRLAIQRGFQNLDDSHKLAIAKRHSKEGFLGVFNVEEGQSKMIYY